MSGLIQPWRSRQTPAADWRQLEVTLAEQAAWLHSLFFLALALLPSSLSEEESACAEACLSGVEPCGLLPGLLARLLPGLPMARPISWTAQCPVAWQP